MVLPLGFRAIYALVDPSDGLVKYVGVTDNPQLRFARHLKPSMRGGKIDQKILYEWITALRAKNLLPVFVFLDSVPSDKALQEELIWIQHFGKISPLKNKKKK